MVTLTEVTTSAGSVTVGTPKTATTTIEDPVVDSINRVNTSVLPGVARALSASTLGGVSGRMAQAAGGTTALKLKGEGLFAHAQVKESNTIASLEVDVNQLRGTLEGSHAHRLASGGRLVPPVEVGGRLDGGDGETGAGFEVGGGLSFADPGTGLTVEGRGRALVVHGGNYKEWGFGGLVRLEPGAAGRGGPTGRSACEDRDQGQELPLSRASYVVSGELPEPTALPSRLGTLDQPTLLQYVDETVRDVLR